MTFRVWGEVERDGARWSRVKGGGTTRRRGMEWHGMPRCRQRAEWLNASKGRPALRCIAWHGQSAAVSRLTPHSSRLTPLPASFVAHQPALPFFSLESQPPVGKMGEKERRRKWHEGGITGETEELTISTICTTVYITTYYGTLCLRAHDGCPRWCRPLLGAIMLVNQASRQGSKEASMPCLAL